MQKLLTITGIMIALTMTALPIFAAPTCPDGVTPKKSGCPVDSSEQLIAFDSFDSQQMDGWSTPATVVPICNNDPMLVLVGNEKSTGSAKSYTDLPEHNYARIQATAYFIDDWVTETAVLSYEGGIIWTDSHNQQNSLSQLYLCGSQAYAESKLGVPIDILIPHTASSITLSINTTLGSNINASFGLDDVRISVFSYAP